MNLKHLDTIANTMLVIFLLCLPICFITFAAGPNDWPPVVYVGIAAFLYAKYALFIAVPLKITVYLLQKIAR